MAFESVDPDSRRSRDALRAAQLYYLQDLTMEAIAAELRTSRSSVSRLLSYARDTGLVQVSIQSPLDQMGRIEQEVRARFSVTAHVVPIPDRTSDVDRLDRVGLSAARILATLVESNMTIGVSWGSTLSAVARHLSMKKTHNSHIVQLNGAANVRTSGIPYAGEILGRFGVAFAAEVHQFSVPALFDDPATKEAMWRERSTRRILDIRQRMDLAVFGLGSPDAVVPSRVYSSDYFDLEDQDALARSGAVGDIATVFYRADGSTEGISLNDRSSGPPIELMRSVPRRLCIVSGVSKLNSLRGALAAGVVTDLVVDEATARHLVDS